MGLFFIDSPRFPEDVSYGIRGGPEFLTYLDEKESGYHVADRRRLKALWKFNAKHGLRNRADMERIRSIFLICAGKWGAFRYKDWADFTCVESVGGGVGIWTDGLTGATMYAPTSRQGYGVPTYQISKNYVFGSYAYARNLFKPVAATVILKRDGTPLVLGGYPGNAVLNLDMGQYTFVAEQTQIISSHTVGGTHQMTLNSAFSPNFTVGQNVFLRTVTGTAASRLNTMPLPITAVAGNVITVGVNTSGLTAAGGYAEYYPQNIHVLSASCEFDVPCRFDTDSMMTDFSSFERQDWPDIPLSEVRMQE